MRSLFLFSTIVRRFGVFNRLIPDAALSASVYPMGGVAPKINNLHIFGKKPASAKFKASIIPSCGSSKVKPGLQRLLSLFLPLLVFAHLCYLVFLPKNYTIVSILNENFVISLWYFSNKIFRVILRLKSFSNIADGKIAKTSIWFLSFKRSSSWKFISSRNGILRLPL